MKSQKNHVRRGFTLVELLVVIVIIATLVAISITAVVRFRSSADKVVVLGNLRQLQAANISYSSDNQGSFVPPEAIEVDANGDPTGERYDWFENPDFVSQFKGEQATFATTDGSPNTTLPLSLMDPIVAKAKSGNFQDLFGSYSYVRPQVPKNIRISQLQDAARSAAFITTVNGDGLVDFTTKQDVAYRHSKIAAVVYYGGHAAMITPASVNSFVIDSAFWEATE